MIPLDAFPALIAALNFLTGCLLLVGHGFMRRGLIARHRATMLAAFATSVVFLGCYLWYHAHAGVKLFPGGGWPRRAYLAMLVSHTVLAAVVPPLAIVSLTLGLRGRIPAHRRVARWTYPIWLYVSATGVLIWLVLYRPWEA